MQFHFDQSKVRSEIRLREGRARPIDVLTKHLNGSDDLDIEINEPYMVFKVNTKCFSFILFLIFLTVVMSRLISLDMLHNDLIYGAGFDCERNE